MLESEPTELIESASLADVNTNPRVRQLMEGLLRISNLVGSVMLLDDILNRIVGITSELMDVPICSIYLFNEDRSRLILRSNVGFEPELVGTASFAAEEGIPGWVAREGKTLWLADARKSPHYAPLPSAIELECQAYICTPMRIQDEIIGVMTGRKKERHEFSELEVIFFETICKNVAIVIEKSRLYHEKLSAEHLAAVAVSLSGVAHYIKNVLFTLKGAEFLVEQGLTHNNLQGTRDGWEVLKRSNKKIRGLVENILNYCRQEELPHELIMLNAAIREILETVENVATERNVELIGELDEQVGSVEINHDAFYDALLNLVTNAVEAIPGDRKGKVWVTTRALPGRNQVRIDIIDNGVGIPEENRGRIFNLFFSTKGKQGTGIGLAATRKIIEDHGGAIELQSRESADGEATGTGAHFTIYLPTVNHHTPEPEQA